MCIRDRIKKKAAIAKAEAEKEIAVAKAEADRQSNDARINSEREIAIKNNELDMQKAELQKNAEMCIRDRAHTDAPGVVERFAIAHFPDKFFQKGDVLMVHVGVLSLIHI